MTRCSSLGMSRHVVSSLLGGPTTPTTEPDAGEPENIAGLEG